MGADESPVLRNGGDVSEMKPRLGITVMQKFALFGMLAPSLLRRVKLLDGGKIISLPRLRAILLSDHRAANRAFKCTVRGRG